MNLRLNNQLNMVGACLTIAQTTENKPVWNGKAPEDFATDLAALQAAYEATLAKAAQVDTGGGAADAKAVAESALEEAAFLVARALSAHFRKRGAIELLAKVDHSRTDLRQMRHRDLLARATEIRDLATAAQAEPGAAGRGLTPGRVEALADAVAAFAAAMNAPREQVVSRATLLQELEDDVAALMKAVAALDDLVVQFSGAPAGDRFVAAWRRARIIIDRVGRQPAEELAKVAEGALAGANPA